jgi:hypothetical protein
MRTQVGQKAPHEARVVGLAEDVFFVERHYSDRVGPHPHAWPSLTLRILK